MAKGIYARGFKRARRGKRRNVWKKGHYHDVRARYGIAKSLGYNGFHCFKETTSGVMRIAPDGQNPYNHTVSSITIGNVNYSNRFLFNLNQCPDYVSYKELFDLFRITGVRLKFFPTSSVGINTTGTETGGAGGNTVTTQIGSVPALVYEKDKTDSNQLVNWNTFMERDPKFMYLDKPKSIYMKPKLLMIQQDQGLGASSINVKTSNRPWCLTTNLVPPQAPGATPQPYDYHGLDMGVFNINTNAVVPFTLTYYFQCKQAS